MLNHLWPRAMVTIGYIANYGYSDALGDYYTAVDSEGCDGCGKCVEACPSGVFEVAVDDYDQPVARVRDGVSRELKYICGLCRPTGSPKRLKCHQACPRGAISHSW